MLCEAEWWILVFDHAVVCLFCSPICTHVISENASAFASTMRSGSYRFYPTTLPWWFGLSESIRIIYIIQRLSNSLLDAFCFCATFKLGFYQSKVNSCSQWNWASYIWSPSRTVNVTMPFGIFMHRNGRSDYQWYLFVFRSLDGFWFCKRMIEDEYSSLIFDWNLWDAGLVCH